MKEKLDEVGSNFKEKYLLTNALDEIAWLLNLRGNDIDFNPVFFSYLVIEKTDSGITPHFFISKSKIVNVAEYLEANGVVVHEYGEIFAFVQSLADEVRVDGSKCSAALYEKIAKPINKSSIISELKAIKNPREIQGFRDSHVRDGLALCKYLAWLENELKIGNVWTEYTAAEVLTNFRKQVTLNMGLSFGTISSVGANAAVIHYKPEKDTASNVTNESIYLLDSGGHYLDGTIDTTRTVHFGTPTDWEKECYTRVLLGNFDLERMIWPNSWSISGAELDIMARRRLWEVGLEYNHGTGHGVGYYLNVHEGPQGISQGIMRLGISAYV
jgi:Xaa-Pro aminopeptidase